MTEHHDHRTIAHPSRPAATARGAAPAPAPTLRLLVDGAGDGVSLRLDRPR